MPATTPNDDKVWMTVASMGNNVWIDAAPGQKWRVRYKQLPIGEFAEFRSVLEAAQEYIKAMHALKGT